MKMNMNPAKKSRLRKAEDLAIDAQCMASVANGLAEDCDQRLLEAAKVAAEFRKRLDALESEVRAARGRILPADPPNQGEAQAFGTVTGRWKFGDRVDLDRVAREVEHEERVRKWDGQFERWQKANEAALAREREAALERDMNLAESHAYARVVVCRAATVATVVAFALGLALGAFLVG